jgi:spore coat protein U-like protein
MDAPQELVQELPSGNYNIIAIADEFIRNVDSAVTVAKEVLTNQVNELLKLAENAIIVESISANPEVITLGGTAYVNIACMSTLGQNLDFNWSITAALIPTSAPITTNCLSNTAEGTYNVACEIKDSFGNLKNVQSSVS